MICVTVPPLRQRRSDVPLLARHFVDKYCELYGLPEKEIAPALMDQFMAQSWSGNVRSLENMVQRGVLLSADRACIEVSDVMHDFFKDATLSEHAASRQPLHRARTIEAMERLMFLKALKETRLVGGGNADAAASKQLGISSRTIRNKLRKYREEGLIT